MHLQSTIFLKILVDGSFHISHAFFWKKDFQNTAGGLSLSSIRSYIRNKQKNCLLLAFFTISLLRISWKLSVTFPRTGLQRHDNLTSAEPVTHFSHIGITDKTDITYFEKHSCSKQFALQLNWMAKSNIGISKDYFIITKIKNNKNKKQNHDM